MLLHDFQRTLENLNTPRHNAAQWARCCWFGHRLVCGDVVNREARVYGESAEVALIVTSTDGWRWETRWALHDDCWTVDPLSNCPPHVQALAQALGLIPSDFASAVKLAAPQLILGYEMDGPEDGGPRNVAERVHECERAIKSIDERVSAWEGSLTRVDSPDVEALKARHTSSAIAMVEEAMGLFPGVRREG